MVHFSDIFLQEEFDGVLREEVVAEALYQLGCSGSGTEQVYLSLTLSVSRPRSPWVGPYLVFSLVLILIALVAPNLRVLHVMGTRDKSNLCKC